MITHSPHTIASRTECIGCFTVPGVLGGFEVRSMKNRKERPLLMVVRTGWEKAAAYEQFAQYLKSLLRKTVSLVQLTKLFSGMICRIPLSISHKRRLICSSVRKELYLHVTQFNC